MPFGIDLAELSETLASTAEQMEHFGAGIDRVVELLEEQNQILKDMKEKS